MIISFMAGRSQVVGNTIFIVSALAGLAACGYVLRVNSFAIYPDWNFTHTYSCGDIPGVTEIQFTNGSAVVAVPDTATKRYERSQQKIFAGSIDSVVTISIVDVLTVIIEDADCDLNQNVIRMSEGLLPPANPTTPGENYPVWNLVSGEDSSPSQWGATDILFVVFIGIIFAITVLGIVVILVKFLTGTNTAAQNTTRQNTTGQSTTGQNMVVSRTISPAANPAMVEPTGMVTIELSADTATQENDQKKYTD